MDYAQAVEYIHSTYRFGSKLGLDNMRNMLSLMGDPQKGLRFIHIAGTNGKGSTAAFLSNVLIESGLRTGTYTSPYFLVFNERIRLDLDNIGNDDLADVTGYVKQAVDRLVAGGGNHPTEFEIITCAAFEYYKRKKADIVVLETGLGGRLDATNIIDAPVCSVLTKIGYDHKEYLGETLEKIAFEKAGIIKDNTRVYTYEQHPGVLGVIRKVCGEKNASLKEVGTTHEIVSRTIRSQIFRYECSEYEIGLHGDHQIRNSILAVEVLKDMGISEAVIKRGLKKTEWQGRFEVLRESPLFIIDGAHNHDAVVELKKTIKSYFGRKKIIFIIGVFKDKDYAEMIKEISPCAKLFIAVQAEGPRALDADVLVNEIKKNFQNVRKSDKIKEAVTESLKAAAEDDIIIAFGSLSYIGEVKELLKHPGV